MSAVEPVCSAKEAQALTDQIRSAVANLWELLIEAHDRKAWAALGYPSFKRYVETEFGMTDRNARLLINQGRVIRELEAASGGRGLPISANAAKDIAPVLPRVIERVRKETDGLPSEMTGEIGYGSRQAGTGQSETAQGVRRPSVAGAGGYCGDARPG